MMTRSSPEPARVCQAELEHPVLKLSQAGALVVADAVGLLARPPGRAREPGRRVRGPKLSVTEGKTPNLPAEEVAVLIESIPTDTLVGLRLLPGGIRTARGKTGELTENRVDATESDFLMSYLSDNALS